MNQFIHTTDSRIIINNTEFTLAQFVIFEPAYTLPAPYERRTYIQNVSHILLDNDGFAFQDLGAVWPLGDLYISKLPDYIAGGTTEALIKFIDDYENLKLSLGATDINDPEFTLDFKNSLLTEAFNLPPVDKISLENDYTEFTTLDETDIHNALKLVIYNRLWECDWTQLSDTVLTAPELADWVTYRDDLKTLCNTPGFTKVSDVTYPTPPSDPRDRC
jgi:hypothetical protein